MPPAVGLLGVGCDTAALAVAVAAQWPGTAVREARVAQDAAAVREAVERWADAADAVHCVLVVGGSGLGPDDVTYAAITPLLTKEAPGIADALTLATLQDDVSAGVFSAPVVGVRHRTLLLALPGDVAAALRAFQALAARLGHALDLLAQGPQDAAVACPGCSRPGRVVNRARRSEYTMVSMEEAYRLLDQHCLTLGPVTLLAGPEGTLAAATGHVLVEDVVAPTHHPPFRASIKDGYAVWSADGIGVWPVAGSMLAGADPAALHLRPGSIIRVTTGSPVPEGADAVIQVEDTELVEKDMTRDEELRVRVLTPAVPGQDIRPVGCDLAAGALVLPRGTLLGPAEVGLLCAVGRQSVTVLRKPRVALLSTGDELRKPTPDQPLPPGCIYDANAGMLQAALQGLHYAVLDLGIARDNADDLYAKLKEGLASADLVVTSGGVSMGECDLVKQFIAQEHGVTHFGRVCMKPGKPTTFATFNVAGQQRVLLGLPGNPVSALVCLYLFVVPALRKMAGQTPLHLPRVAAKLSTRLKLDPERPEYHRAVLRWSVAEGGFVAESTGLQASHRLLSLRSANALLELPQRAGYCEAGATVAAILIGPPLT